MTQKPQVGDTVYLRNISCNNKNTNEIMEAQVEAVGRKWFSVVGVYRHQFDVLTGKQKPTEYMDKYFVYFSKETFESEQNEIALRAELKELVFACQKWPKGLLKNVVDLIKNNTCPTKP